MIWTISHTPSSLPFVLLGRDKHTIIKNSRGSGCSFILMLPHNVEIPLYTGYDNRAELKSQNYCKDGISRQRPRTKITLPTVSQ